MSSKLCLTVDYFYKTRTRPVSSDTDHHREAMAGARRKWLSSPSHPQFLPRNYGHYFKWQNLFFFRKQKQNKQIEKAAKKRSGNSSTVSWRPTDMVTESTSGTVLLPVTQPLCTHTSASPRPRCSILSLGNTWDAYGEPRKRKNELLNQIPWLSFFLIYRFK